MSTDPQTMPTPEQLALARDVLLALSRRPGPWPTHDATLAEVVRLAAALVRRQRRQEQQDDRRRDAELRAGTGIRSSTPAAGPQPLLARPRSCAICGTSYERLPPFYDSLCPACGELNLTRRTQSADLAGRIALVSGGRIKAGFQVVLKLLRGGARVIALTRFPRDAARRFAAEPDASTWAERLQLKGLDLRDLAAVEELGRQLRRHEPYLDIFIANAAQTVRRPPAFYHSLLEAEQEPMASLPETAQAMLGTDDRSLTPRRMDLPLVPLLPEDAGTEAYFPAGQLDADGQPLDLRPDNSWGLPQEKVSTVELVEVHVVNCLAPFLLLRELRPLFRLGPARDRFAVMVSAAEGRFAAARSSRHPHTNMAKASLNMLVRTSAAELAAERVFLTAVDPGWFSIQQAAPRAEALAAAGVQTPLDAVDAAARILAPVFDGITHGAPAHGVLFKDYQVAAW
jgi:NAD(P)-dependent dehydrogenase (short-subunit alcohol dehydrogenase family)